MNTILKQQLFNFVQGINPKKNEISSLGEYISPLERQIAQRTINEIKDTVSEQSLAFKILSGMNDFFSEKQMWVIVFELLKNEDFINKFENAKAQEKLKYDLKISEQKNKLKENKENSSEILEEIKKAGKKLGDYYNFVKTNKKFSKEFYSKKFTKESVSCFLSI